MRAADAGMPRSLSDRVYEFLNPVDYRAAHSQRERDAIYRLRYDAYLREGYIAPRHSKQLSDELDALPNVWTFGVHVDGQLAGTIRLHVLTEDHRESLAHQLFAGWLDPRLDAGSINVEPSKFVIDKECAR